MCHKKYIQETNITMPNIITITLQWTDLLFDVVLSELTVVVVVFFVVLVNNGNWDNQSNEVVVGGAVVEDLAGAR